MDRTAGALEVSYTLLNNFKIPIFLFNSSEFHEMASSGFLHTDMIGQKYLCFLLPKSAKLNLVKIEINSKNALILKSTYGLTAKDAVVMDVSSFSLA